MSQLLSVSEQTEMRMNKSFDPFDKLIPIQYSPYTGLIFKPKSDEKCQIISIWISEPLWRAAVNQFENSLGPAERRIAGKLRSQLVSCIRVMIYTSPKVKWSKWCSRFALKKTVKFWKIHTYFKNVKFWKFKFLNGYILTYRKIAKTSTAYTKNFQKFSWLIIETL